MDAEPTDTPRNLSPTGHRRRPPDLPPPPRRYDEKEVARLLERASELQRALPTARNPTGTTLADIEEIAAEAGLDPGLIRQAASELDAGSATGWRPKLLGAPYTVMLERTLPFEVPASALAELAPLIQTGTDLPGNASLVGGSLSWSSTYNDTKTRTFQVMVLTGPRETQIRIVERYPDLAMATFGVGGGGGRDHRPRCRYRCRHGARLHRPFGGPSGSLHRGRVCRPPCDLFVGRPEETAGPARSDDADRGNPRPRRPRP